MQPVVGIWQWVRRPRSWMIIGFVLFIMYFGALVVFRHANLMSSQYDLGNMDQVLWHTVHGRWFVMTDPLSGHQQARTAVHADFLLMIYAPFYALWQDPRIAMVLQVAAVATGVFPLFWFAKKYVSERSAALFGLAFLLYPMIHWAVVFDIHAVVLAIPLFLWAVWAAAERRWWVYWLSIALVLLAKEEIGVTAALLGIYVSAWRKPRWIGLATVIVGLGWSAFMLWYAIPTARHFPGHFALSYYSDFGGSTTSVVTGILTHPLQVISKVFDLEGVHYVFDLLLPLGGLSLLGLPLLAAATPELLVNLLSSNPNLRSFYFQYASVIIPFVFLSAVLGWHWLQRWLGSRRKLYAAAATIVIAANLISVQRWALLPGTRNHNNAILPFVTNEYAREVKTIAASIPVSHAVATTNNIAPHFTQRDFEWSFPRNLDQADDVVVLVGAEFEVESPADIQRDVDALQRDPHWRLMFHRDRLYHFARVEQDS